MVGFLIRRVVSETHLFEAIAKVLGLPIDAVTRLDIHQKSDAAVLVEINDCTAGFLMDINLYIDTRQAPNAAGRSSLDVAAPVAMYLQDEVLVSPPADDFYADAAYTWYLITPDGKRFIADELDPDPRGENIEIDRATLRPA